MLHKKARRNFLRENDVLQLAPVTLPTIGLKITSEQDGVDATAFVNSGSKRFDSNGETIFNIIPKDGEPEH